MCGYELPFNLIDFSVSTLVAMFTIKITELYDGTYFLN